VGQATWRKARQIRDNLFLVRRPVRAVLEGTTFLATVTLAVSLLLPWYWSGEGGPLNAFQGRVFADKVLALAILISAVLLIAVITLRFGERRSTGNDVLPWLYLALATFDLALTLLLYFSPAAPPLPYGSVSQSPGVYLGLIASALALLATVPLQRGRRRLRT
jgi:hypothetical protein